MNNSTTPSSFSKPSYVQLLQDPRWRAKRIEILERADYACEKCGSRHSLHVHHLKYERHKRPWEYPNNLLRCLCNDCHEQSHGIHSFHTRHPEPREFKYALYEVLTQVAAMNGYSINDFIGID